MCSATLCSKMPVGVTNARTQCRPVGKHARTYLTRVHNRNKILIEFAMHVCDMNCIGAQRPCTFFLPASSTEREQNCPARHRAPYAFCMRCPFDGAFWSCACVCTHELMRAPLTVNTGQLATHRHTMQHNVHSRRAGRELSAPPNIFGVHVCTHTNTNTHSVHIV